MPDANDMDLVREYAARHSEPAFETLVRRHVSLVYAVALRQTGNAAQAEEITQAVFLILARKAANLRPDTVLAAWLHETARHAAASFLRGEARRIRREQEAFMQSNFQESPNTDSVWEQLAPLLDEAIGQLSKADRSAVVLRFFQNKSAREMAAVLKVHESAAQKRVNRAVEKLRAWFLKRGVAVPTDVLTGALSVNSVPGAPAHLAASVIAASTKGAAVSSSTSTLIKGALKIMAWTKAKTAIVVGVVAILTAGTGTVIVKRVMHPNAYPKGWADDPSYWRLNNPPLASYPPVLILRPTRFPGRGGGIGNGNRFLQRDAPIQELVAIAYDFRATRIVFPPDLPPARPRPGYDLMLTLPHHPLQALRETIQKRFGLVAHTETVVTNVLLVKVANPDAPGLKPASWAPGQQSGWFGQNWSLTIRNQPLDNFLGEYVESQVGQPVLNETGLSGRYNLHIQWRPQAGETDKSAFVRALREQLGLELVPANRPVKMLVVEKAK